MCTDGRTDRQTAIQTVRQINKHTTSNAVNCAAQLTNIQKRKIQRSKRKVSLVFQTI